MEFFLTIVVCTAINNQCVEVPIDKHDYRRVHKNHYQCVQKGLGESYDILYQGDFDEQDIVKYRMYPKFVCQEAIVPPKKPTPDEKSNA